MTIQSSDIGLPTPILPAPRGNHTSTREACTHNVPITLSCECDRRQTCLRWIALPQGVFLAEGLQLLPVLLLRQRRVQIDDEIGQGVLRRSAVGLQRTRFLIPVNEVDMPKSDKHFQERVSDREKSRLDKEKQDKKIWFGLGMFGMVGWSIAIPAVLGVFLGVWIDRQSASRYSWTNCLA